MQSIKRKRPNCSVTSEATAAAKKIPPDNPSRALALLREYGMARMPYYYLCETTFKGPEPFIGRRCDENVLSRQEAG